MRTIQSRLGNKIEISDGEDDATTAVTITLKNGATKLALTQDGVTVDANKKTLSLVSGDGSIEIDDSGNITIKGKKVTIDGGTGDVEISGNNVKINGKAGITIAAKGPLKAEGAMANLESKGITTVKGSMVKIN